MGDSVYHREAHALVRDLRAWLEWAEATGAVMVPASPPRARAASPPRARAATPSPRPAARPSAPPAPDARGESRRRSEAPAPPEAPAAGVAPVGAEAVDHVRADLGDCTRCGLAEGRRQIVFGAGAPDADLMLIGEAPGSHEDRLGEPFVGRSGQLLTRMLQCIGLKRVDVYICNVIKCRPPHNRDPAPDEIAACSPFLRRQIAAVRPRVIMTLGRFASVNISGIDAPMRRLRGQVRSHRDIPVVPTYHPSYLLRQPHKKALAWEDVLRVRALLRGA